MRVTRTFAFLDLCGFTSHTEERGDEAAVAVLATLRLLVREEAAEWGVRVTKWLGDGVMLSGTEAEAVLRCCVAVRDRVGAVSPLPLRGGVAGGPVIMFEGDDYVGAAVNVAARLCQVARPNQLLAAASVADAQDSVLVARRLPDVRVEGVHAPVAVRELVVAEVEGSSA